MDQLIRVIARDAPVKAMAISARDTVERARAIHDCWPVASAALKRTFRRVYDALEPGGLFLFDVKTPAALEGADGETYLDEDDGLFCVWRADYDPRRRVCAYGLDLFVRREDGGWDRGGEYHEEYAYTLDELSAFLQNAGFESIKIYGDKTMRAPKEGAQRVFFAAKKEQ